MKEKNIARHCMDCKTKIFECMGFVVFGDFLEALSGQREWKNVRERCGKCVEIWSLNRKKEEVI